MLFPTPNSKGYTIYTKSNCSYCIKAKQLLSDSGLSLQYGENMKEIRDTTASVIDCDSFIKYQDKREAFLAFIAVLVGKPYNTFPIVFYDGKFVGGYTELSKEWVKKKAQSDAFSEIE
jgi:glutaredoxin